MLTELGELALVRDDPVTAEDHLREALGLLEQVGYVDGLAQVKDLLACIAVGAGDWQLALDGFKSANLLYGEFGNRYGVALTLAQEASAEVQLDLTGVAARHASEAVELANEVAHPRAVAAAFQAAAAVLAKAHHDPDAVTMISAADSVRRRNVIPSSSNDPFRKVAVAGLSTESEGAPAAEPSDDEIRRAVERVASL